MPPFGSINRRDLIRYLKDVGFDEILYFKVHTLRSVVK